MKGPDDDAALWGLLRGQSCLWHRTSVAALDGILRDHEITPNGGQFEATTPQSASSYARRMGAVSLFDFDSASEVDFETHRYDYWRGEVFIRIRPNALDKARLRRADEIWTDSDLSHEDRHKLVRIPYLEVVHMGPVPESAFDGFILLATSGSSRDQFWRETTSDAGGLKKLTEIVNNWNADAVREKANRHARGEYTLAEMVEASMCRDSVS